MPFHQLDYHWRFLIPLNHLELNGVEFWTNRDDTIFKIREKEDLNKILNRKPEFDFEPVDTDKIQESQIFYDWVEDNFPLLHELEYELSIYHHQSDIVDWFDGNYFFIGKRYDGLEVLITRYTHEVGTFAIVGAKKPAKEAVLKYFDVEVSP